MKVTVEYIDQLYLAENVEIKTGIAKIGNSSFTIMEEIYQTNRLCAKGEEFMSTITLKKKNQRLSLMKSGINFKY